jgi:hypothetical protein
MKEDTLWQMEKEVLREGREWTRKRLEQRLQAQAETLVVCPQSGLVLKKLRTHIFTLITAVGLVTVQAPYGFSSHADGWCCPAREHWGLAERQRLSPEFEQRLTFTATQTGSFEKASALAECWGCSISDDAIHALVQRVGARALVTPPPTPLKKPSEPAFSLVIMMDGWQMRERGVQWGAPPQDAKLERIAWHEVKSAVMYRLEQRAENQSGRGQLIEKKVVACAPNTAPLEFGAAVQAEAMRCGLARAQEVFVVADGAVWIWRLTQDRFATATKILDFYHASQHLWDLAHHLHPGASEAARQWIEPLLHSLRHDPEHRVIETLEALLSPSPKASPAEAPSVEASPDPALVTKVEYFRNHRDHLDYATLAARGAPIGSGSMESQCSQFQNRLKRRGQFWSPDGLRHLLALDVAVKNRTYTHFWN